MASSHKQRRVRRVVERVVLGGVMSAAAFVIERRLLKAVRAKGERERAQAAGGLAASPNEVEEQRQGQGA